MPSPKAASGQPAPAPRQVQTARVTQRPIERSVIALGSLMAHEQATLSTKVPGRVQSLLVDVGSVVRHGDVLARMEPRDYELKVQQAGAALAQSRAVLGLPLEGEDDQVDPEKVSAVMEARAVLTEGQTNFDRITRLSREKLISLSEVDSAELAYLVALNRYQNALKAVRQQQAMVAQRRAEFEIARQQLTDTTITAPFDGGIQERQASLGEYLPIGSPVVMLVKLDPLRMRVEVSERDAARVCLGQQVRFTREGDTNIFAGKVQRLSPALDERNRMLRVEADIRNDGRLHPGSFARAEIVTEPDSPALTVPTNAVIAFAGLEKAFTVENGTAVEKRILTGSQAQGWVEVVAGLTAGEIVILDPGNLQTGHPVIIDHASK